MQIVIDIPEETVNEIKDNAMFAGSISSEILWDVTSAIVNGTPLPKGHGALKDVTNLMRGLYTDMQTIEETFTSSDVYKMIDEECPTIIEADKAESEDKE